LAPTTISVCDCLNGLERIHVPHVNNFIFTWDIS
jgi:hypothetical protein